MSILFPLESTVLCVGYNKNSLLGFIHIYRNDLSIGDDIVGIYICCVGVAKTNLCSKCALGIFILYFYWVEHGIFPLYATQAWVLVSAYSYP